MIVAPLVAALPPSAPVPGDALLGGVPVDPVDPVDPADPVDSVDPVPVDMEPDKPVLPAPPPAAAAEPCRFCPVFPGEVMLPAPALIAVSG